MKILQICKKFPFPLKDGESIAITNLGKALQLNGAQVSLLAMNTSKHYFNLDELPDNFDHYQNIWTVDVDNRIKPTAALGNLFSSKSFHIERYYTEPFEVKLTSILENEEFDIIQLETLYLTPYIDCIRKHSKAKIVLRSHNVEFEIWERLTKNEKNKIKKEYLAYLTAKLRKFEVEQLSRVDAIVSITERDMEQYRKLGFKKEGKVLPIGLDLNDYKEDDSSFNEPLSLSFIGSLDWQPNVEGLVWFLNGPWKLLRKSFKNLTFNIAGRNMPDELLKYQSENVKIHGEVPDAQAFISKYSIMLVPLLSGGGMRAKILEGMALGKIVLSTQIGIEGIPVVNGEQAYIANSPEEFKAAIQYCLAQNGELKEMGKNARHFIGEHYDNKMLALKVIDFYQKLCSLKMERKEARPIFVQ